MKERITLSGSDAELFRELKGHIEDRRGGHSASNSEVARRALEAYAQSELRR